MTTPDNFVITLGDVFTVIEFAIALVIFIICVLILLFFKVKALIQRRQAKKNFEKLDREQEKKND